MFSFDHWAEWLHAQQVELARQGLDCVFKDGRSIPELASNPSYLVEATAGSRMGYISFWSNGFCDYEILDAGNDGFVATQSMLEANDETVASHFKAFLRILRG